MRVVAKLRHRRGGGPVMLLRLVMAVLFVAAVRVVAQAPVAIDHANPMVFVDDAGKARPVKSAEDWAKRRKLILAGMQEVMGPLPADERRVPLDLKVTETVEAEGYVRKAVSIAVEKGDRVSAYLLVPKGLSGKVPGVLCLHQTTKIGKGSPAGLGDRAPMHVGVELAKRGYVVVAPDYPYFGESKSDPYALGYVSATMKGIWNHMRCVDLLQSLDEVDGGRIGCVGHSLGGHNSLFVAAFDERIKAVVTSCGFTSFPTYYGGNLTGWSSDKYMPRIASVYGKDPKRMPFDFPEVLAAIAPRAVFVAAPVEDANFEVSGVRDCVGAAEKVYELLGAKGKLVAVYPEAKHDFVEEARKGAWAFLDRELKQR
jgi:dienelactone hydrolase